ncbi:TPA: SpoV family signaling peptide [Streptococcus pyogenes]
MKKKLSLFMIATAAVVSLSLATPENQTVSANDTQVTCVGCPDCGPKMVLLSIDLYARFVKRLGQVSSILLHLGILLL